MIPNIPPTQIAKKLNPYSLKRKLAVILASDMDTDAITAKILDIITKYRKNQILEKESKVLEKPFRALYGGATWQMKKRKAANI